MNHTSFSFALVGNRAIPRNCLRFSSPSEKAVLKFARREWPKAAMFGSQFRYLSSIDREIWGRAKQRLDERDSHGKENENAVTAGLLSPSTLSGPIPSPSYFDKTFVKPAFIWNNGKADLDRVNQDILKQPARLGLLLDHVPHVPVNATTPAPLGDAIEAKKADLKASIKVPTREVELRSAVMPLVSDVWNAVEPLNYVGDDMFNGRYWH